MSISVISDYRAAARRSLPRMIFDYIDGGSYGENTLARNVDDFRRYELRQRVLVDTSALNLEQNLFGHRMAMPVMLGPVGMAGMFARRGEVQAARAAGRAGIPFCLSTFGICSLEEIAAANEAPPWFQLYMVKDRGMMRALLERAAALGSPALIFTVDIPVAGARYRDARSGLSGNPSPLTVARQIAGGAFHPGWTWDVYLRGRPHQFGNLSGVERAGKGLGSFMGWIRDNFDPSTTWRDIAWIRSIWPGPILLKGILNPDDARLALDVGADGIIVSNHGGRQLDDVRSTIRALPAVADAIAGEIPVLLDGGIRSGLDVLKALALGAHACLLGRLWAYALAAEGGSGVERMLGLLRQELIVAMTLTGCVDVRTAARSLVEIAE